MYLQFQNPPKLVYSSQQSTELKLQILDKSQDLIQNTSEHHSTMWYRSWGDRQWTANGRRHIIQLKL